VPIVGPGPPLVAQACPPWRGGQALPFASILWCRGEVCLRAVAGGTGAPARASGVQWRGHPPSGGLSACAACRAPRVGRAPDSETTSGTKRTQRTFSRAMKKPRGCHPEPAACPDLQIPCRAPTSGRRVRDLHFAEDTRTPHVGPLSSWRVVGMPQGIFSAKCKGGTLVAAGGNGTSFFLSPLPLPRLPAAPPALPAGCAPTCLCVRASNRAWPGERARAGSLRWC
jgi:hypothetical protein